MKDTLSKESSLDRAGLSRKREAQMEIIQTTKVLLISPVLIHSIPWDHQACVCLTPEFIRAPPQQSSDNSSPLQVARRVPNSRTLTQQPSFLVLGLS